MNKKLLQSLKYCEFCTNFEVHLTATTATRFNLSLDLDFFFRDSTQKKVNFLKAAQKRRVF